MLPPARNHDQTFDRRIAVHSNCLAFQRDELKPVYGKLIAYISLRMRKTARVAQREPLSIMRLDRESEQSAGLQHCGDGAKDAVKGADIHEHISGNRQIGPNRTLAELLKVGAFKPVVDLLGHRLVEHASRNVEPDQFRSKRAQTFAHQSGSTAKVERQFEAHGRRRMGRRKDGAFEQIRNAIAELANKRSIKGRCVVIKQCFDEPAGRRSRGRNRADHRQLELCSGSISRVEAQTRPIGFLGKMQQVRRLIELTQPKPAQRPAGRQFQRAHEKLRSGGGIALGKQHFRIVGAAVGDRVAGRSLERCDCHEGAPKWMKAGSAAPKMQSCNKPAGGSLSEWKGSVIRASRAAFLEHDLPYLPIMRAQDLLHPRPEGLYCPPGDFFIDPSRPVDRALITHGHADHARAGHRAVLATQQTLDIMALRYGENFVQSTQVAELGKKVSINDVGVCFHPAGHVLGSAQIAVECDGMRIVASGDYKRRPDPTCAPFEPIRCDVFITEATFGLPVFRHPPADAEAIRLLRSVQQFPDRSHLIGAYSLGKAQRVIRLIRDGGYAEPIYIHGAMEKLCAYYQTQGVDLGDLKPATTTDGAKQDFSGAIVVGPPSAFADRWARRFPDPLLAFASGWMRIRQRAKQQGVELPLIISDHSDWDELIETIRDTGAGEVWVTHGREEALVRWCELEGVSAKALHLIGFEDEGE